MPLILWVPKAPFRLFYLSEGARSEAGKTGDWPMTQAQDRQDTSYLWVVFAACAGVFAVAYNTTAVMTTLPAMKSGLDLSVNTMQWVVVIYMLATATSLTALGHFADMFGLVRIFFVGLAAFAIGGLANAVANDAAVVLVGRVFQGIGAAGLLATAVAMISVASPEDKRARGLGMVAASLAFGFALGPLIGGALTDVFGWRSIFVFDLANIFIAAVVCFTVARRNLVPQALEVGSRIDYAGIVLLCVALGAFLYGLTSGQLSGWTSAQTLMLFVVSVIAAIAFAARERRTQDPLINFHFFRYADYVASTGGMFALGFAQIGVLLFTNLFMQAPDGFGFSASTAGLALLPFTLAMLVASLTAPRVLDESALRIPITVGLLMVALGLWLARDTGTYGDLWWKLIVLGAGAGMGRSLLLRVGLRALPDTSAGQGAGVLNTCYFSGLATGAAVGGAVTAHVQRGVIDPAVERLLPHSPDLGKLQVTLVHGSETQVMRALAQFSPGDADKLQNLMRSVFDSAFAFVMDTMSLVALAGAILCAVLIRNRTLER